MNKIAHILLGGLILSLLVFTSVRTFHFLSLTFPADQQYMPALGLAAFDGGVLLWSGFARAGAKGWQRAISYIMIFVCMTGVIVCTWADTFLVSSANGLVRLPVGTADMALRAVLVVIVLNVVAGVVVPLVSPEGFREWEEEKARDKIESEALKQIQARSLNIAPDVANQLTEQWVAQTYSNLMLVAPSKKKVNEVGDEPIAR